MKTKKAKKPKDASLRKLMLRALKEAATVIMAQNHGNCLVSVEEAIAKAEGRE